MPDEPSIVSGAQEQALDIDQEGTLGTTSGYIPYITGGVFMGASGKRLRCDRCRRSFERDHIAPGTNKPTPKGEALGLLNNEQGELRHNCAFDPRKRGNLTKGGKR